MQISDFTLDKYKKLLYLKKHKNFLKSLVGVGIFQQGQSGNRKHNIFFRPQIKSVCSENKAQHENFNINDDKL